MADLCAEISAAIDAPVVDGVTAALKLCEALVALKLATAKRGEYARPLAKSYSGTFSAHSPAAERIVPPLERVPASNATPS
jgi:allantoin racemase